MCRAVKQIVCVHIRVAQNSGGGTRLKMTQSSNVHVPAVI